MYSVLEDGGHAEIIHAEESMPVMWAQRGESVEVSAPSPQPMSRSVSAWLD